MKFKDYEAAKREYEDWASERFKEDEPRREAHRAFLLAHRREWDLGVTSYVHLTPGNHVIVRCDGANMYDFGVWLSDGLDRNHQVGMSVPLLALSSTQWRLFAETVAAVERWKAGEIDHLPPSGVWPGAEGASR